ncbi:hypothetical protein Tco_0662568 [Tanacetum coccineum]
MSDSEHSTVTYTSVPFPVEDDSDIGSPGIDGPPIMPEDPYAYIMAAYEVPPSPDYIPGPEVPPSPDYIPGPEVPPSPDYIPGPEEPQSPPPLDFVPEPMYPEYMPQEDEILPAEEQPLPAAASPTADSPGYIPESDPLQVFGVRNICMFYKLDANIIMSDSEHSTVTYTSVSILVEDDSDIGSPGINGPPIMPEDPYAYIMAAYQVPPSPDYIPGPEVPPSPDYIPGPEEPQSPPPLDFVLEPMYPEYIPQEDEILSAEEQPLPVAASPTADSLGYVPESDPEEDLADYPADKDDYDDDEDEDEDEEEEEEHPAPADSIPPVHPSPPLPIPSPPPNSPTHIEIPESCLPLQKRVRFASPTPSHEVGESSAVGAARQDGHAVAKEDPYSIARGDLYGFVDMIDVAPRHPMSRELDYGITDTWDDLVGAIDEIAPTTLEGVNQRVTDLSTIVEQETTIMYGIMEDAQDDRSQLRDRVNLLYRDRTVHRRLAVMIEREAKMAREAWGLSMDASDYARSDVMSLHTTVMAQSALISEFQSADHRRQWVIKELWASDHKRQVQLTKALELLKGLQTQMAEL